MGRRRAKAAKVVKKPKPKMATEFKCPFCNHSGCVGATMDYDKEVGTLDCRVCAATYSATINYLSEPIDVFSEWIDHCEAEAEEDDRRRADGDDMAAPNPRAKRRRLDDEDDDGGEEAMADPRDNPALHAGD